MRYLKRFNESKAEKPGPNVSGSVKITISDEEVNSFSDEPALSKLIYDDKVSLLGNEVWYLENDEQTKAILDQYLEVAGKNELEEITESTDDLESKVDKILEDLYDDIEVGGFKLADLKTYTKKIVDLIKKDS